MRLKTLDIRGFGQLRGVVDLETGRGTIALLLERNEAGKSTLASAITGALYGLESSRTRYRNRMTPHGRFRPWEGGNYGLELLLDRGGTELRIARDFERGTVEVYEGARDITSEFRRGKSVEVGEILTGLTRAQFELSAFVPQGAIVWDDPSGLAEALQRAADSQAGENTAAAAIQALQSGLEQYEGVVLKRGLVRTEIQRCDEEIASARARLGDLDRLRDELDARIEQLHRYEAEGDASRARRELLRLRRAATELEHEQQALQADDDRRKRRDELVARLSEDPELERIDERARRDVEAARRRHGILQSKLRDLEEGLAQASARRHDDQGALQETSLAGIPSREQVTELGAWRHALADLQRERVELEKGLAQEHDRLRSAGFDPDHAARLGSLFSGIGDADRALLGSLRKRRVELEDEAERLRERLEAASRELETVAADQLRRRRLGLAFCATGLLAAVAGILVAGSLEFPDWAGPVPGAAMLAWGIFLAGTAAGHRTSAASAAEARERDVGDELARVDVARSELGEGLEGLASRLGCSPEELEESWRAWLDLQPYTTSLAVLEERLERLTSERNRLAEQVAGLAEVVGRVPDLDELEDLYRAFQQVRESADRAATAEADISRLEAERIAKSAELDESERAVRDQLSGMGVELEPGTPLEHGFARFEERAARAMEIARLREAEFAPLERMIATDEQRAVRVERIESLVGRLAERRPVVERELSRLGAEGRELIASLDEPLTEEQLQRELRSLEAEIERRHAESTRQLTDVRSFVERYEREAPALRERIDELELARRRAREFETAVALARNTLEDLAQQTHRIWSRELATRTNRMLASMGSDIGEVAFDEKLHLSLVQRGRRMSGNDVGDSLSTGVRDLLHLACRLSLAHFLSGGGLDLPLILDDPFAHCDDSRTVAGVQVLLEKIAPDHQVILLACQRSRYEWVADQLDDSDRIRPLALEVRA